MFFTITAAAAIAAAQPANASAARDADTRAWWATTAALSGDSMEGRDSGTPGHRRAAELVAKRFAAAGLRPGGEGGGWFQPVPMEEVALPAATTRIAIAGRPLAFLHDLTVAPAPGMATRIDAPVAFRGYCGAEALGDVRGKAVICWGVNRPGLPDAAARTTAVRAAGAVALLTVADPGFTVEPPRWPFAYARTLWLRGDAPKDDPLVRMTLNADALPRLLAGGGRDVAALVAAGSAGRPLPAFDLAGHLVAGFAPVHRALVSDNVIGVLPGTDPARADQHLVLSAHLDGYGHGEPVKGDGLYNGTFDDAAYVALLVRTAERRAGRGYRRPVIFSAFTGEEKGLLGARWFVAHPTVPKASLAADLNLDQLRPIFPLERLTVHALGDTTLGDDARAVAGTMGITVQADPEPQRNLNRRADHWPFLQAGVPATGFVFGYVPGSASERRYREWYWTRYHKPQDDLTQPIDWRAAADFNRLFYGLVERVADADAPPSWKPGSALRPAGTP